MVERVAGERGGGVMSGLLAENTPASEDGVRSRVMLALSSGVMLGFAFPPSPFYTLGYVAFIPFLFLLDRLGSYLQVLRYSYLTLFLFHVITLYWVGGFTHAKDTYLVISGGALLVFHPMFYWIPLLSFFFVRRHLGRRNSLVAFPFLWTSFDYLHSLSEFSFPWVTLGNSQASDLNRIQIAEYTSVYGLSFLLLAFNTVGFVLLGKLGGRIWRLRSLRAQATVLLLLGLYLIPWMYGRSRIQNVSAEAMQNRLDVGIVQPNVDPWEKWGEGVASKRESYDRQLNLLLAGTDSLLTEKKDLIVWPETAIPYYLFLPQNEWSWSRLREYVDSVGVPIFTGLPHVEYFDSLHASATARRINATNMFYESFNAATLLMPGESNRTVYKKIVLVPFAERIPYADALSFLVEPLKWGVGISGWGKGADTVVFSMSTRSGETTKFSGMICYESIFPDFVRHFALKGAQFLVIITNDSWWGNTSGAYQHASYASFRAVENRRWILRSANGGISAFVDPTGRLLDATEMYTQTVIARSIEPRQVLTFYTRYGDLFAQLCLFCSTIFLIMTTASIVRKKKRFE